VRLSTGNAKLRTRHEIPVPPRGYWAEIAHGHKVPQTALAPPTKTYLNHIEIGPTPAPKPSALTEDVVPEIAFELRPENRITVGPRSGRLHPLVRQTREALASQKPLDRWLLYAARRGIEIVRAYADHVKSGLCGRRGGGDHLHRL